MDAQVINRGYSIIFSIKRIMTGYYLLIIDKYSPEVPKVLT
ncbi:MAG: hypothetical protein ACW99U_12440 [Candidatus Thorarchaeota archaeon]